MDRVKRNQGQNHVLGDVEYINHVLGRGYLNQNIVDVEYRNHVLGESQNQNIVDVEYRNHDLIGEGQNRDLRGEGRNRDLGVVDLVKIKNLRKLLTENVLDLVIQI